MGVEMILLFGAAFLLAEAGAQAADGQTGMELAPSETDLFILFAAFAAAVLGLCIFLARDIILRKRSAYDSKEFESKKDRTYEKYHSGWSDDYEELGSRQSTSRKKFTEDAQNSKLPDYYKTLGLERSATRDEIKQQYRMLAKRSHPDKTRDKKSKDMMAEINRAYEVLSDSQLKAEYDRCLD